MALHLLKTAVSVFLLAAPSIALAKDTTRISRVGVIMTGTPKDHGNLLPMLRKGLQALGYVEGRNFLLEPRYDMRDRSRLQKLAEELLQLKVKVIVVTGAGAARAARRASPTTPIVVAVAGDLVGSGLVGSLSKPGGNITGNTSFSGQLTPKQMQLLKEAIPGLRRVGALYSSRRQSSHMAKSFGEMKAAAPSLGLVVQGFGVREKSDLEGAFAAMAEARTGALIVIVSRLTSVHRKEIIRLAANSKIPMMCFRPSMARQGCFMSYGADRSALYRHAATFVHKILQGAKPGDLPIQQATKFNFTINLKRAKALGITVPQSLLLRADEVIE
ncbi:MAG: ABC transporter substrate-binding protein [Alphaproteobacteria bacterium]|nr:ABC transporter substrate-binding protein [Alphaproteobacteria bacterium]